jgi:hypothetical protein
VSTDVEVCSNGHGGADATGVLVSLSDFSVLQSVPLCCTARQLGGNRS